MAADWKTLSDLLGDQPFIIERVRIVGTDTAIEGSFEVPSLARLTEEDQVFVVAFVRCHGSIKHMEKSFGVSYPTIKNRLNRIAEQLEFVEISPPLERSSILSMLESGQISASEAIERLKGNDEESQTEAKRRNDE